MTWQTKFCKVSALEHLSYLVYVICVCVLEMPVVFVDDLAGQKK